MQRFITVKISAINFNAVNVIEAGSHVSFLTQLPTLVLINCIVHETKCSQYFKKHDFDINRWSPFQVTTSTFQFLGASTKVHFWSGIKRVSLCTGTHIFCHLVILVWFCALLNFPYVTKQSIWLLNLPLESAVIPLLCICKCSLCNICK